MVSVRARSAATRLLMLQLHSVSNGPSGEPAPPTAEFIIVVSNVAASRCFEWTEWEPAAPTAEFIIVVSNVPASQCFEWTECIIKHIYIYSVYVDSHSLGQLAIASKRSS